MFRPRIARRDDYPVFVRMWDELRTDQPVFDVDLWDEKYREHTLLFETDDGEIVAYALTVPLGARGDIRQIVVDPRWRGRGVGRALLAAVADKLRAQGCSDWRLEVRADNEAAIALYRRVGMDTIGELFTLRMSSDAAERFAATRSGRLRVEPVTPADDPVLERHFDLGAGQLARWRAARVRGVMSRIAHAAFVHCTKDFAPQISLLYPLRAPDADHAAHLFAKACALGLAGAIETMLPDLAVVAALCDAGAAPHEHLYEMGGPLPG
jgi:ribosomal protein S18 acetylase RimI-like enzyme